jgi:DNA-binding HxlR family transcriptional regulator
MNAKENAAVSQLLGLLEARYAMRVLWALKDGHAQTFRLLQDSVGGITPNTLNTRIKELREAGLVNHASDGQVGRRPVEEEVSTAYKNKNASSPLQAGQDQYPVLFFRL